MISSFLKRKADFSSNAQGAATLIIALVLVVISTLIILFAANYGVMQQKITANLNRNAQAFEAAEGGFEFGINYLQANSATILLNPVGGFIPAYSDVNTTNITLANNSKFSVVYTNPIVNNYNVILISSTGKSDDDSSTRVVMQKVQLGSILSNPGNTSLVSKASVTMSGSANVVNTTTNKTITSASAVSFSGSGQTTTSSGVGSNASHVGSDVQQNSTALASMSQNDFFANFFGTTSTDTVQSQMAHYYNNSTSTNYSGTLNGMTGTSIWIDQTGGSTASISGNTTIGSASNPVLLIVNGGISISGNVTIYGFIFVIGTSGITTLTGNNNIIGGMVVSDILNMSGNSTITYNPNVINALRQNSSMSYWAKVTGTWKDF